MAIPHTDLRDSSRQSESGLVLLFAAAGVFALSIVAWVWLRWITSGYFSPVDPGPDPLPVWQFWILNALQVIGLLGAVRLIQVHVIRPKRATGRFSTEGLVCMAIPTLWFQDVLFGYTQNWQVYNAHLWNLGSWAPFVPGWMAAHPENMHDPIVVFYGYIFWAFGMMLGLTAFMKSIRRRRPQISDAALLSLAFLFAVALDWLAEYGSVRIGWYAQPGAWRAVSLHAGTPYQFSLIELFWGSVQTLSFALILFYRDKHGRSFVEAGADTLRVGEHLRTLIRFFAVAGALHVFFLFTYVMPINWQALHSDAWVPGMPSYFTGTCPEYRTQPERCGGPGIPIHRPDYNWLQEETQ